MQAITLKSYAKINLSLIITGIDTCGYHLLDSVAASVDIFDIITISKNYFGQINIDCEGVLPKQNTAYKCAKMFLHRFAKNDTDGVDVTINKGIPFSAGLGGSSADAAGVLRGLCALYGVNPLSGGIREIAAGSGSDTVYMLSGGYCRLAGRGEIVSPFSCKLPLDIAIIKPPGGVSAADAYREYDKAHAIPDNIDAGDNNKLINFLSEGNIGSQLQKLCINHLQQPAITLLPEIGSILQQAQRFNPVACFMTGSGSAVCAVFKTKELAKNCCNYFIPKGYYVKPCTTKAHGIEFL